jgi:hypothetical protein
MVLLMLILVHANTHVGARAHTSLFCPVHSLFMGFIGSIDNERAFSTMSYIKNSVGNRLSTHLNGAMMVFLQEFYTLETFPYSEAYDFWLKGSQARGRYMVDR